MYYKFPNKSCELSYFHIYLINRGHEKRFSVSKKKLKIRNLNKMIEYCSCTRNWNLISMDR